MKKEALIKKIQALLDKTIENGATQSEMEAALSKATQLIESHNISEYELNQRFEDEKCVLVKVDREKSAYSNIEFLPALCKLFGTQHLFNSYTVSFFGFKSDVELCVYFYKAIAKSLQTGVNNYKKSLDYNLDREFYHGKTLVKSWLRGFQDGVAIKMYKIYIERRQEREKATYGLVLIDREKQVKSEFVNQYKPKMVNKRKINVLGSTYKAGVESGKKFEFNEAISESETTPRLIG